MADGQIAARKPIHLADYQLPAFTVDRVKLEFDLHPRVTWVASTLTLRRTGAGPLRLDGKNLKLREISLNGELLHENQYSVDDTGLSIDGAPDTCTVETLVEICPEQNTELQGLYISGSGFFTQCEPEGFRRITYFPDRPDVMARFHVTLRADSERFPVLLSNGNLLDKGEEDGKAFAVWEDPHPKPAYLFALVAANLVPLRDEFTTASGRKVKLGIWVARGDEGRCAHAMAALKRAMNWDEETFGLEYDLDLFNIAAVSDFNAGAMENKGLNIFNTAYVLASAETATDTDFQNVERVVAHEYFHNWTGNRVTCRDWFQLSLKEGLTVFRDQEYMGSQFSAAVKRIADVRLLRSTQFRDDAGPLAHPVRPASYLEINNFYTTTIYEKGAEVVRMIRTLIGTEAFRQGMDLYIARNDNKAATVENFLAAMQEAAPARDLSQMMRWYTQAGTPEISITEEYIALGGKYTLTLRQHTAPTPGQDEKLPFLIPVVLGLVGPEGEDCRAEMVVLKETEQSFVFAGLPAKPVPSLFRNFSAPVKLKGMKREQLAFLAARDRNQFNRWDALQRYATLVMMEAIEGYQAGHPYVLDDGLKDAIAAILRESPRDPAFAAEALTLPSETLLADEMTVVDPDAIHAVREATRHALGQALRDRFNGIYSEFAKARSADLSANAMAARALKNAALSYVAAAGDLSRAAEQFVNSENMTDTLAALALLAERPGNRRDAALESFHAKWRTTPLVLDKWFAVQCRACAPDTQDRVRQLLVHPDFDWRNPNRVRAVLASFSANPAVFHDASGAGYRLLTDAVLHLDTLNPQVAARLATALSAWRRYAPARQLLMQTELKRLLARERLSPNTYEVVSKALA
jgi:aminopeptidase N